MKLEFLLSYRPKPGSALEVGVGPYGNRLIYERLGRAEVVRS